MLNWKQDKKKILVILGIAMALVLGIILYQYWVRDKSPEELLDCAWKNTVVEKNFSFHTKSTIYIGKRKEVLSDLKGEKNTDGFHAKGIILNTPVDLYLIKETTYIKDPYGDWFTLQDDDMKRQDLLMAEINPLLYLSFKETGKVESEGIEEINGKKSIKLNLQPNVDNQFLRMLYSDFKATIWVDKWSEVFTKVVLEGIGQKVPEDRIVIEITFDDYGKKVKLTPPQVRKR